MVDKDELLKSIVEVEDYCKTTPPNDLPDLIAEDLVKANAMQGQALENVRLSHKFYGQQTGELTPPLDDEGRAVVIPKLRDEKIKGQMEEAKGIVESAERSIRVLGSRIEGLRSLLSYRKSGE